MLRLKSCHEMELDQIMITSTLETKQRIFTVEIYLILDIFFQGQGD